MTSPHKRRFSRDDIAEIEHMRKLMRDRSIPKAQDEEQIGLMLIRAEVGDAWRDTPGV
jgi:hypothetical protein